MTFTIIYLYWGGEGSLNTFLWKIITGSSNTLNTLAADDSVMI